MRCWASSQYLKLSIRRDENFHPPRSPRKCTERSITRTVSSLAIMFCALIAEGQEGPSQLILSRGYHDYLQGLLPFFLLPRLAKNNTQPTSGGRVIFCALYEMSIRPAAFVRVGYLENPKCMTHLVWAMKPNSVWEKNSTRCGASLMFIFCAWGVNWQLCQPQFGAAQKALI